MDIIIKVNVFLLFICMRHNFGNGYIQSGSEVLTTGSPILETKGCTYRVVMGDTLLLPCVVRELGPYVVLWRRKNVVLTAHDLLVTRDPRYSLINDFNLQITNVTSKDAGEYVCQIAYIKSSDVIHKVEVLVPPSIRTTPGSGQLTVRKGENVTLKCKASGNPAPNVVWFRKKNISQVEEIKGVSMTLEKVDRHHAGVYKCTADNGVGAPATLDMQLDVLSPPEIEIDSPGYSKYENSSLELTCRVHGNPTPNVVWYIDGMLITSLKRYHMYSSGNLYNLKIEDVQVSDFGNFTCESENSLGKTRKFIQLTGNPSRATFLSSPYSHTMNSFNLTWFVQSFAPIDEVRLLFRKLQINESYQQLGMWQEILLKASSKGPFPQLMSYNIEGLGISSVFQALLQVRNRFGWGEESDLYQFYTRGPSEELYELNVMDVNLIYSVSSKTKHFVPVFTWLVCYLIYCSR